MSDHDVDSSSNISMVAEKHPPLKTVVVKKKSKKFDKVLSNEILRTPENSIPVTSLGGNGTKTYKKVSTVNSKDVSGNWNGNGKSTAVARKAKTSTHGPHKISKKEVNLTKHTKNDTKQDKIPHFHLMKKVRFPPQVKVGLARIFDQLVTFPYKNVADQFMKNGVEDIVESGTLTKLEASKNRKERAISYCEKIRQDCVGREAANTLMVVFYNPASVSILMEEIKTSDKELPAQILVVRFHTAFVVIVTHANSLSRFPYMPLIETGDYSSCFLWFNTKDITWSQTFPSRKRRVEKMAVLQKATPLTIVGHVIVSFFEARSEPWDHALTITDKTNYNMYIKPIAKMEDNGVAMVDEVLGFSWVRSVTTFVSSFSVVKLKAEKTQIKLVNPVEPIIIELVDFLVSSTVGQSEQAETSVGVGGSSEMKTLQSDE